MKRFYLLPLISLIYLPVHAKNKISMVTYFPVPYVAYSQVNATESMDIGLTTTCDMKLGCTESSTTLNVTNKVNLQSGRLDLNGGRGIKGEALTLGSGTNTGEISFQNVRINTGTMESVNATDTKADTLNLFGKAFPSCKSANSTSNGQMRWASLKLKGSAKNELYLACGEAGTVEEQSCLENPNQEKCCLSTQTWNGIRCVNNNKKKRCLSKVIMCGGAEIDTGKRHNDPGSECVNTPESSRKIMSCTELKLKSTSGATWGYYYPDNRALSGYAKISDTGCTPGTECNTCILGQKYTENVHLNLLQGAPCCDLETQHVLYLIPYALCTEMEDCSQGTVSSCSSWRDTGNGSSIPLPFLPGQQEAL